MSQHEVWRKLPVLVNRHQIDEAVLRLGNNISRDYAHQTPLLIGVLKGCFIFMADLARSVTVPCEVEFIQLSSYGAGTKSAGTVNIVSDIRAPIAGRHIIIVEDLVDTGATISFLMELLASQSPASIKLCTMFIKGGTQDFPFAIDYVGIEIGKEFVVGYGMDYAEQYRSLPDLRILQVGNNA